MSRETVTIDTKKWEVDFVRKQKLRKVNVFEYYLGGVPQGVTSRDCEYVVTDLFRDAVAVGALTLPAPFIPEDFTFQGLFQDSRFASVGVAVGLKGKSFAEVVLAYPTSESQTMGNVGYFITALWATLKELVETNT